MLYYEAIIVKPTRQLKKTWLDSIPEFDCKTPCYMVCDESHWAESVSVRLGVKWDPLYYVVNRVTKHRKGKFLNWRIHKDMKYVQLYWAPKDCPTQLINGTHVHIIRVKYQCIFNFIITLIRVAYRAKTRIRTRKSLIVANIFPTELNQLTNGFI